MKFKTLFILLLFLIPSNVFAATASFDGNKSIAEGASGSVSFYVNGNGATIGTVDGTFSSSNTACIQITSVASANASANVNPISTNNFKLAYMDMSGVGFTNAKLVTVNFKSVGSTCSATINYTNVEIGNTDAVAVTGNNASSNITVLSNNNNLESLSTSVGTINFNPSTTSYSLQVDSNVTSITINATAVSGATLSGTGSKNLGYGNNSFSITVTAQSGSKKTYTVNINRKDDRSSDNTLKSLVINEGTLEPNFNGNTTSYSLLVPFEVTSLKINAVVNNSKASVSTVGNENFISEETQNVIIRVTAENGNVKEYVIAVTRGKDPNKPLSNDNNLTSLTPSSGQLSPAFNSETLNYLVWVPYEVDKVNLDFVKSDLKYATTELIGNEVLTVGENLYEIKVTAEDLTIKTYTVTVMRGYSLESLEEKSSLLKSLEIKNGSLKQVFDSSTFYYEYTGKNIEVNAIPLESDTVVVVNNINDVITIFTTSSTGEISSYVLIPYESDLIWYIIIAVLILIPIIIFAIFKIKNKKQKIKAIKVKKVKKRTKLEDEIINVEIKKEAE